MLLQTYSGLEEAVYRNIEACKEFGQTLRTAYGPQGRNKMIINHIEKLFVTNDAATIIKELEVRAYCFIISGKVWTTVCFDILSVIVPYRFSTPAWIKMYRN